MYLLYFMLWVIFNGKITLEIVIFGLIIAAALLLFTCRFADYSLKKEKKLLQNTFRILRYILILTIEIVKANGAVIKLILSEEEEPEPALVTFQTDLKGTMTKSFLANAITLTPGTITVLLEDNTYTVHCLDEEMALGLDSSVIVDMLRDIEQS